MRDLAPLDEDRHWINPETNIATNVIFEPLNSSGSDTAVMPDFSWWPTRSTPSSPPCKAWAGTSVASATRKPTNSLSSTSATSSSTATRTSSQRKSDRASITSTASSDLRNRRPAAAARRGAPASRPGVARAKTGLRLDLLEVPLLEQPSHWSTRAISAMPTSSWRVVLRRRARRSRGGSLLPEREGRSETAPARACHGRRPSRSGSKSCRERRCE